MSQYQPKIQARQFVGAKMCQKIKLEEKCPLTEVGDLEINLSLLATSLASVLSLEEIQ